MLSIIGNRRGYAWTGVWILFGFIIGFVIVFFQPVLQAWPLLLWAMAYIVAGGVTGMIFAIPKEIKAMPGVAIPDNGKNSDEVKEFNLQATQALKRNFEENTNLNQISDWLTKVIVGAGLVQLKDIPGFVIKVAERMSRGLIKPNHNIDAAISTSAGIIIYFTVFGFITGYLVTKVMITDLLEGPDSSL